MIRKETLYPSHRKAQGSSKDTVTFLGVRFYIDFEVSLVDKRFKGFRDWGGGAENEPDRG